jgi:hypothetical protein
MCKQTHHHFLVGQEKQLSNGIVNNEYRINLVQFRIQYIDLVGQLWSFLTLGL